MSYKKYIIIVTIKLMLIMQEIGIYSCADKTDESILKIVDNKCKVCNCKYSNSLTNLYHYDMYRRKVFMALMIMMTMISKGNTITIFQVLVVKYKLTLKL